MIERKEYCAGAVKMSFWFMEFRKVVGLLAAGKSFDVVKRLSQEENLFSAPTMTRANQIYSTVSGRIKMLDESFYEVFLASDLATQKLFALVAAMAYDTLFFDFVYEVIREKMIIGSNQLADSDVNIFFKNKQQQDEKIAGWTDVTLTRLGRCYKTMLYEAGMIDKAKEERRILKPILDSKIQQWLEEHDLVVYINALTGVR